MGDEKKLINVDTIKASAIGMLLKAAFDMLQLVLPAAASVLSEYLKERDTPDGWTKRERVPFLIGQLVIIQKGTVGNYWIDKAVDLAIGALIKDLEEEGLGPVPVPPPDPWPHLDPYWRSLSEEEYAEAKAQGLIPGATVYKGPFDGRVVWFITTPGIGAAIPPEFEKVEQIPFDDR